MKKSTLNAVIFTATIGLSTSSCQRNNSITDELTVFSDASETQARSEYIDQDASDLIEESAAQVGLFGGGNGCNGTFPLLAGSCATITTSGAFPSKTIVIDFGTGCTSPKGIVRSGIINVTLTDSLKNPGSVATITFNNYFVNGFKRDGIITRTNTTVSGGNPSWNRTVVNGQITSPSGLVRSFSKNIDVTQTAGMATPCDRSDDIYLLEGTRSVTGVGGVTRVFTTQTALQKKGNCSNIDQGILNIQVGNKTATLDFGNGNCDNQAIMTVPGKAPKTITLK